MSRLKLGISLAMFFVLVGCADSEMENVLISHQTATLTVNETDPSGFLDALLSNKMGETLVGFAQGRLMSGENITFEYAEYVPKETMVYMGRGHVLYGLISGWAEQLAFHEVFHIFQCGDEPKWILNNEVEAYLAQYIYCKRRGKETKFSTLSPALTEAIKNLARAVNLSTGLPNSGLFRAFYDKAMQVIKSLPLYQDESWVTIDSYDLSNLQSLLKYS